jgi:Zn-dependent protease
MLSLFFSNPLLFVIEAGLLLLAISMHEFSHALAADKLGDPTPRLQGRLTINPRAHLDPIGTILLLFAGFGWGRPVQIDPFNLRNPRKDSAIIAFAGAFSNILMALIASFIIRLLGNFPVLTISLFVTQLLSLFIYYNLLLAIFNLIPIYPLDGFNVVAGLLPKKYYHDWMELSRYGMIFLILLIFPFFGNSPISSFIQPVLQFLINILIPSRIGGII